MLSAAPPHKKLFLLINNQGETVIGAGDSVRFEKNEVREIVNRGAMTAKMLVIAGLPKPI